MLTRTISGAVMVALLIPCFIFSHLILLEVIFALLCLAACYEMLGCLGKGNAWFISIPTYVIALGLPFFVRQIDTGIPISELILVVFIVYMFYVLGVAVFSHGKHTPSDIGLLFTMIFYIIFGFTSFIAIRSIDSKGAFLYILVFISAWISDTGAYFTGVLFGKHKLIPDVSPKKTVEGAVGGLFFCVLAFLLYGFILGKYFDRSPDYIILGIMGFFLSLVSMCGDLIASLIKRQFKVKDYGNLIPGHGGIMDRFDSTIATSSVLFVLLNIPYIVQNII
ncbi:MAG: CDP-archaeol synthase [Ruminococcaceae bacterium]|nr:CDP-archaeol synthase [Oscillospiraceae bacterium]